MRLIDADILKEELARNITIWNFNVSYDGMLAEIIDNVPTVEIPKGEWIEHERNYDSHSHRMFVSCECSACHVYEDFPEDDETGNVLTSHYCKWCGSNMWKEDNE